MNTTNQKSFVYLKSTTFAPDTKKHPVAPSFEIFIDETLKIIDFQEKKI
jgi:hypothetical protein